MKTPNIARWNTKTAAAIAKLDLEAAAVVAAVKAFRSKATRLVVRVHAQAEKITGVIYEAGDCDLDPVLEQLGELPSADSDDVDGAVEALEAYRSELVDLARGVAAVAAAAAEGAPAAALAAVATAAQAVPAAALNEAQAVA